MSPARRALRRSIAGFCRRTVSPFPFQPLTVLVLDFPFHLAAPAAPAHPRESLLEFLPCLRERRISAIQVRLRGREVVFPFLDRRHARLKLRELRAVPFSGCPEFFLPRIEVSGANRKGFARLREIGLVPVQEGAAILRLPEFLREGVGSFPGLCLALRRGGFPELEGPLRLLRGLHPGDGPGPPPFEDLFLLRGSPLPVPEGRLPVAHLRRGEFDPLLLSIEFSLTADEILPGLPQGRLLLGEFDPEPFQLLRTDLEIRLEARGASLPPP